MQKEAGDSQGAGVCEAGRKGAEIHAELGLNLETAGVGKGQLGLQEQEDGRLDGVEERCMSGERHVVPSRDWSTAHRDRDGDKDEETQPLSVSHTDTWLQNSDPPALLPL